MQKAEADIARVDAKLGNANFVARAPEEVVEEEKEKRAEAVGRKEKIAEALERLKGAGLGPCRPAAVMPAKAGIHNNTICHRNAAMLDHPLSPDDDSRSIETPCSKTATPSAHNATAHRPPW